jgi:hypothetical protein
LRIEITSTGSFLTKAAKLEVRRSMLLAMSRFGKEVEGVTVRLAETRNPLGGVDQRCRVRVRLRSGPVLHANAIDGERAAAASRSAARLARLVAAELDGGHDRAPLTPALRPRGSDE